MTLAWMPKTGWYADDPIDISGYNKCSYFHCIVLPYVRRYNDPWL